MKEFFKLLKAIVIDLFMSELNEQEVRLTIASNKNNAIKALSILEKEDNFRRVVAVIDADFLRI